MRLYDYLPSGNGYKVRLMLAHLGKDFELVELDIVQKETRTPDFMAINPNGRIPVLEFDDGSALWESNAILWYLAKETEFWPKEPWLQAQVMQWMCFEQYSHEPYIATVRHWVAHLGRGDDANWAEKLNERRTGGNDALSIMEHHLADRQFFVGASYSIADIALFSYTHVADEGGFDLSHYPSIQRWIEEVRRQPGHIPITFRPTAG
jgi:glutathione S-transferase